MQEPQENKTGNVTFEVSLKCMPVFVPAALAFL
jgi:hypothetical protein